MIGVKMKLEKLCEAETRKMKKHSLLGVIPSSRMRAKF
jgi:hypothetical protein